MAIKNLDDLVEAVQGVTQTNRPKSEINGMLKAAFWAIKNLADSGETVRIHNFGTFVNKTRAARAGRNPATGEAIQIAESTSLQFKATKHSK